MLETEDARKLGQHKHNITVADYVNQMREINQENDASSLPHKIPTCLKPAF